MTAEHTTYTVLLHQQNQTRQMLTACIAAYPDQFDPEVSASTQTPDALRKTLVCFLLLTAEQADLLEKNGFTLIKNQVIHHIGPVTKYDDQ